MLDRPRRSPESPSPVGPPLISMEPSGMMSIICLEGNSGAAAGTLQVKEIYGSQDAASAGVPYLVH